MIIPLFSLCIFPSLASKALHLGLGRVVQWENQGEPNPIERLRLSVSRTLAEGNGSPVKVHIIRLRWSAPHNWNDDGNEDGRTYNIVCEGEESSTSQSFALIDILISADITAIHERFNFPETALSIICAVRAVNSEENKSKWKYSKLILVGTELGMMEEETKQVANDEKKPTEAKNVEESKETADISDLKSLLAESKLEEIPYPKWEKRPPIDTNGTEIIEEEEEEEITASMETTTTFEDETIMENSSTTEGSEEMVETTLVPNTDETTMALTEMMLLIHATEKEPIPEENEDMEENLSKADQIIREPDLFFRGLALKPSDLPEAESREDLHQELPFRSEIFDEVLKMVPGKLSAKEKEDYDLLEARIRDVIGSPNLERVL